MTDVTADPDGTRTAYRTCPLCEATCGLEITLEGDRVKRIRGDRDDVFSAGFICPKGSTLKQLHEDPDRLRRPLVRRDDALVEATWEEAFKAVADGLGAVRAEHGNDAVGIYLGNPNVHNLAGSLYVRPLVKALESKNVYSASTVDQMPMHVAAGLMFGGPSTIPVSDLDRTDYLLMLGANPYESNGSLCTAPDFPGRLEAIQERGGTIVVVDPKRTKTAEHADVHLAIRPGTDAHLLAAMINILFAEDLVDLGAVADHVAGVDAVRDAVAPFTPEVMADLCGLDADTIRGLTRDFAAAPSASAYSRVGTQTAAFGTLTAWGVDTLTALTGNLDRPGGSMFPLPAHGKRPGEPGGRGFSTGRWTSRVRDLPEVRSELPGATLAEEMTTPGEGRIRALLTVAGNPALSTPGSDQLEEALADLEFMVSVDIYVNETTRHADVILPTPSALERSHYDLAFYGLSVRNVANYSPAVLEPDEGAMSESDVLAKLALILGGQGPDADPAIIDDLMLDLLIGSAQRAPDSPVADRDAGDIRAAIGTERAGPDRLVDLLLRVGPYGEGFGDDPKGLSLDHLEDNPHGVDLGPLEPRVPEILDTPSAQIELGPESVVADLDRLAGTLSTAAAANGHLLLIGRRHLRSNNSWMHNVNVLVKGKNRCTLQMHPDDAARLGLDDGGVARVTSAVASLDAPVEVTDAVRTGVVSLPHGWGHDRPGAQLGVAADRPGVNSNRLTDPAVIDPLSGNAALNAIPVTVTPS
jgi:anaerobic selenocysteine-containing dehydrogenase